MLWKVVSWNPLASLPVEHGWKSTFYATETFGAINDDVSVWDVVLDLYRGWRQRRQLLRHVLKDPLEHGRST